MDRSVDLHDNCSRHDEPPEPSDTGDGSQHAVARRTD